MSHALAAYLSHSWKTHLPLNLAIWQRLHKTCHLLIDKPVQQTRHVSPPYYISRIESILRRSDVFVACLPAIEAGDLASIVGRTGDWSLRCSPYICFEIRLAERADLPRFILYDPKTGFQPPPNPGAHARYVAARLNEIAVRIEARRDDVALTEFEHWITWLERNLRPGIEREQFACAILLAKEGDSTVHGVIKKAIKSVGFGEPVDLLRGFPHDTELIRTLRSLKLLVVDFASQTMLPLYHMAHSLMVPSIRLHSQAPTERHNALPDLLRGHPAGYQEDLLTCEVPESLLSGIAQRAEAVLHDANPIADLECGNYELQQRAYLRHLVFFSHNLKGEERELVDSLCLQCRDLGIDFWEYEQRNRAGEDWTKNLDQALEDMTHFVALATPTYDHSPMCMKELRRAKERAATGKVELLPFRVYDRASPMVELRDESRTHQPLPSKQTAVQNARTVVENILRLIRRA